MERCQIQFESRALRDTSKKFYRECCHKAFVQKRNCLILGYWLEKHIIGILITMLCAAALLLIVQNMILTVIIVTLLPISFFLYIKACETTTFRDTNVFKNDDFVDKKFNGIIRDNYFNADYLFKNAKSYSILIMYLLLACSEFMVLSMNLESDDTLFVRFKDSGDNIKEVGLSVQINYIQDIDNAFICSKNDEIDLLYIILPYQLKGRSFEFSFI